MAKRYGVKTVINDLLASGYDWFTEGFDMADLKEGKALVQELV